MKSIALSVSFLLPLSAFAFPTFVRGQGQNIDLLPATYRIYEEGGFWIEEYTLNGRKNLLSYPEEDYALLDGIRRGEKFLQDNVGWTTQKWVIRYDVPRRIAYITSDAGGIIELDYPDSMTEAEFTKNADNVYKIVSTEVITREVSGESPFSLLSDLVLAPLYAFSDLVLAPLTILMCPFLILTPASYVSSLENMRDELLSPIGRACWGVPIDLIIRLLPTPSEMMVLNTPEYIAGLNAVNESVDFLKRSIDQYGAVYNYTTIRDYIESQTETAVSSLLLAKYPVNIRTSTYTSTITNTTSTTTVDTNKAVRDNQMRAVMNALNSTIERAVGEVLQYQLSYFLPPSTEGGIVAEPHTSPLPSNTTGAVSIGRAQAEIMTAEQAIMSYSIITEATNFLLALLPFLAPIIDYAMETATICIPLLFTYADMYTAYISFIAVSLISFPLISCIAPISDLLFLFVRTVPFGYMFEPLFTIALIPLDILISLSIRLLSSFGTVPFIGSVIRGFSSAILVPLMFLPSSRFFPSFTEALKETVLGVVE